MTVSLRGGAPRFRKRLPPRLDHHQATREIPEQVANRLLCLALASMAQRAGGDRPDPLVTYAGTRYRLIGDLVNGSLYDLQRRDRRFVINEGRLRAVVTVSTTAEYAAAAQLPSTSAIARVSYVLEATTTRRAAKLPLEGQVDV
jgi:hypothetical protein